MNPKLARNISYIMDHMWDGGTVYVVDDNAVVGGFAGRVKPGGVTRITQSASVGPVAIFEDSLGNKLKAALEHIDSRCMYQHLDELGGE